MLTELRTLQPGLGPRHETGLQTFYKPCSLNRFWWVSEFTSPAFPRWTDNKPRSALEDFRVFRLGVILSHYLPRKKKQKKTDHLSREGVLRSPIVWRKKYQVPPQHLSIPVCQSGLPADWWSRPTSLMYPSQSLRAGEKRCGDIDQSLSRICFIHI